MWVTAGNPRVDRALRWCAPRFAPAMQRNAARGTRRPGPRGHRDVSVVDLAAEDVVPAGIGHSDDTLFRHACRRSACRTEGACDAYQQRRGRLSAHLKRSWYGEHRGQPRRKDFSIEERSEPAASTRNDTVLPSRPTVVGGGSRYRRGATAGGGTCHGRAVANSASVWMARSLGDYSVDVVTPTSGDGPLRGRRHVCASRACGAVRRLDTLCICRSRNCGANPAEKRVRASETEERQVGHVWRNAWRVGRRSAFPPGHLPPAPSP